MNPITRLTKTIRRDGLRKTVRLLVGRVFTTPEQRRSRAEGLAWDRAHGTDTEQFVVPDAGDVCGGNWIAGHRYQGISPVDFIQALEGFEEDLRRFAFVDLGSGKGRAVLMAALSGRFRYAVGVEYAASLCAVAEANRTALGVRLDCPVKMVREDAADFIPPFGPVFLFLYNPFGVDLMARTVQMWTDKRPLIVLSFGSAGVDLWRGLPGMRTVADDGWRVILRRD